jgi:hypothetical protein
MAMALARSLEQGRPDSEIPKSMVFSYVGFSILLARYVQEQTEIWRFPPPLSSSPTAGGIESSPDIAPGMAEDTRAGQSDSEISEGRI